VATSAHPDGQRQMIAAARALLDLGLHSVSKHGNLSVRVPGTDQMLLSSVSTLDQLGEEQIALLDLDGNRLEGEVLPVMAEVIHMHAVVYQLRPEIGGVIHTHSPHATAFAVASRPIERVYEGLARWEQVDPVPVAAYGPRGSRESIDNIRRAIESTPATKAVLLANHGVLVFDRNLESAVRVHTGLEEAAQLSLLADSIGGPKEIPIEMAQAAIRRRDEFARTG
jgi:L-fuculose-phosphate aldolase